ncbi:hypothetical protein [Myroides pelagicus]|uniref:Cytochrome C oxidase subunit I n=1 Tax=Myroides pelagicus TaxID=270914 RepID=A0A7K1GRU6_9FLAO|nr:hypothetical protein [Myroides pelagicus]MEC4114624.1 hypothetical protein [Myroides pelagicus]MTH30704.1 hypothetical protein [Myroides pelagicus]
MKPIYYIIPLFNFLVAALFGLLLRSMYVYPIEEVSFLYILHTHSHIALLGWLYLLVYVLFVQKFGIRSPGETKFYIRLFWVTQLSVIGMASTFPFMGYAAPSIAFSTLHIICSYLFVFHLWKHHTVSGTQQGVLLKTALFFMVFSTLGVWCLGPAVGMMGKTSAFYHVCIQFFLHFQFDGWFLTAFLVILFATVFKRQPLRQFKLFYCIWIASIILTYGLPLSWYVEFPIFYYLNMIGVFLQLYAVGYLIKPIFSIFKQGDYQQGIFTDLLVLLALSCVIIRIGTQLLSVSDTLSSQLQSLRSWIIGFIHLNMLGVFTAFGLWLMIKEHKLIVNTWTKLGIGFLILGFLLTESILLQQGLQSFMSINGNLNAPMLLFWSSVLLPISILCFLVSYLKSKKL